MAAIEAALPADVSVAGSSYRGVGVPDCIHQGELAATHIIAALKSKLSGNKEPLPMNTSESDRLFAEAQRLIPGGVNSPVRAFRGVGGAPRFIASGSGAWMTDVDGNRYLDYVLSWGPLVLGHAHPAVVAALTDALPRGTSYGAPTALESELAERIIAIVPSVEMIRFVNSGTEATMSALRLARAATGRDKIVKFAGCYHGHADMLLVQAGSGVATLGLPDSPGVPASAVANTLDGGI